MRLRKASQPGRLATGKSAPEMKNIGITISCIRPMKDCICLTRTAAITPKAVMLKASSSCRPKTPTISASE